MKDSPLAKIQRTNLVLGAVLAVAAGAWSGPRGFVAAALGAAIGNLNFIAMARIAGSVVSRVAADGRTGGARGLGAVLTLKMIVLFSVVALALRLFALPILPFTFGLVVFVPSCLGVGLWLAATNQEAEI